MKVLHTVHIPHIEYDPYQNLAIGVIQQAVDDYRSLTRKLLLPASAEEKEKIMNEVGSIRHFFLGNWFSILSDGQSGEMILKRLDEEVPEVD